jgi:hypothetical protein
MIMNSKNDTASPSPYQQRLRVASDPPSLQSLLLDGANYYAMTSTARSKHSQLTWSNQRQRVSSMRVIKHRQNMDSARIIQAALAFLDDMAEDVIELKNGDEDSKTASF